MARAKELQQKGSIAAAELSAAETNANVAKAAVAAAEANVKQSEGGVEEAQRNLDYTRITSPIDGVVINRRVNPGQNVTPDPKTGSLFLIAKDFDKMQVWTQVNEADIGKIKEGMDASFKVDAFPGEFFKGKVTQIRHNAQQTQNVVTYTVVVSFDNPDKKLLPYMTANVRFVVGIHKDVLYVPDAALRFSPPQEMWPEKRLPSGANIWVKYQGGKALVPIAVEVVAWEGKMTEVSGPGIKEGMDVMLGRDSPIENRLSPPVTSPAEPAIPQIQPPSDAVPIPEAPIGSQNELPADLEKAMNSPQQPAWDPLGLGFAEIPAKEFRKKNPSRYRGGLSVIAVRPNSPAANGGAKVGDVLVGIHIWETASMESLSYILKRPDFASFSPVKFYILRGKETLYGYLPLPAEMNKTPPNRVVVKPPMVNAAAELKALQGQWKVVRQENGEAADTLWLVYFHAGKLSRLAFKQEYLGLVNFADEDHEDLIFRVDPTADPKRIDILDQSSEGGMSVGGMGGMGGMTLAPGVTGQLSGGKLAALGIYRFDGPQLRICLAKYQLSLVTDQRPKSFAFDPQSGDSWLTLERYRPSEDEKKMAGDWTPARYTVDGKPSPEDWIRDTVCSIDDSMLFITSPGGIGAAIPYLRAPFLLDETKNPKQITVFTTDALSATPMKKIKLNGIYKLEGDRLTLAYRKGDEPPEKFESAAGSGVTLLELKRGESKPAIDARSDSR